MIWLLARREIVTRGRTKGYRIVTLVLFLAVIVLGVVPSLIGGDDDAREVDVGVAEVPAVLTDALDAGSEDFDVTIVDVSEEEVESSLTRGEVDVVVTDGSLVWEGSPDTELDEFLRLTVERIALGERAAAFGLDADDVTALFTPIDLEEVRLDGDDDTDGIRFLAGFIAGILTFMFLQTWGSFVMMGVVEEKSSRIVEILLAQVRPRTLLAGKVLGLGILALAQMLVVGVAGAISLVFVRDVDVPSGVWATVPLLIVTFLLAFAFYATWFAAVGSMVSRQEDAQGVALPVVAPLLVAYLIGSASLTTPANGAMTIGSVIPFTSPVLLPMRVALTDVPAWQVALSLVILATSAVLMLRVAGWIYRFALLRTGARIRWRELWRARSTPSETA